MLVFTYGSLMRGLHNHVFMEESNGKFVSEHTIDGFELHSVGDFPAIKKGDGEIKGELYDVKDTGHLDYLEGISSNLYKRVMIGEILVYVGDRVFDYGTKKLSHGDWRKHIEGATQCA